MATGTSLITEREAAKTLGIVPATMRRWRWRGYGPEFVKVGSAVRYAPAALDAFIAIGTVTPASAAL